MITWLAVAIGYLTARISRSANASSVKNYAVEASARRTCETRCVRTVAVGPFSFPPPLLEDVRSVVFFFCFKSDRRMWVATQQLRRRGIDNDEAKPADRQAIAVSYSVFQHPKICTRQYTHAGTTHVQKNALQEYEHISMVVILQWVMQCSVFL